MKDKQDYFKDKQMDERAAELKTLFKHDTIDLKETVIDIHSYTEIHTSVQAAINVYFLFLKCGIVKLVFSVQYIAYLYYFYYQ